MRREEREALEAAGWTFGDAEDFLDLTPEERQLVELRLAVSSAFRKRRLSQRLTQKETAKKLGTSQPRVAKIEAAAQDVTLDLMFRGLITLGGTIKDVRTTATAKQKFVYKPGRKASKTGSAMKTASQPTPPRSTAAKKRPTPKTGTTMRIAAVKKRSGGGVK